MNLEKNSIEMKTVVETFIIEETAELIYDNEKLDKWNEHVKALGLEGQTKISKPDKSPIPFMHIKASLQNIMECLCPCKVDIGQYDKTPIPVEILDLVALSLNEKYFQKVQIWYDDKSPDPFCIGLAGHFIAYDKSYTTLKTFNTAAEAKEEKESNSNVYGTQFRETGRYLLGKWADVKHSFEELKEIAKKRFIAEKGNEYRKSIKEAQRGLDDLETEAFDKFN